MSGGRTTDDVGASSFVSTVATMPMDEKLYLAAAIRYADNAVDFYVNGALIETVATSFPTSQTPATPSSNAAIGADDDGTVNFMVGILDEVRFSTVARNEAWMAADYQSGNGLFSAVGVVETLAP
jgi:hypothetical protein